MAAKLKTLLPLLLLALLSLSTLFSTSQAKGDPRLRECEHECSQRPRHQREQCERECWRRHQQEREREREREHVNPWKEGEEEERQENPYVFRREHFKDKLRTEHGHLRVLQNFAKKSKLLLGIANYRIAVIELNPRTFLLPNHWDADDVCYVVKGSGIVTILNNEEKISHKIRQGDITKVDAGSIVYVTNSDSREKLVIAKLVSPVSIPGKFEAFFGAGGENPESFYRAFSDEVLEAAFNTRRDTIERVFGRQRRGPIVRASEEQIRSMTREVSGGGHRWPFGEAGRQGESGPFNLFRQRPTFSNQHGALYEADSNDCRELGELDVKVSVANISSGSMLAPSFNSRSTKIAVVVEGRGRMEMICPHLGKKWETGTRKSWERYEGEEEEEDQGQHGQQGRRYRTVRANLTPGTVFVVPAGHPTVEIASRDENLQIMCFDIRAEKNEKIFLAGRNNVLRKMEREAKELAFDTSAKEVDELFNSQREEAFVAGPGSRGSPRGGGHDRGREIIKSVLEVARGM